MRSLFPFTLLLCSLSLIAQGKPPVKSERPKVYYQPDVKQWRLEILTPIGGWTNEGTRELQVKLWDLKDPKPPKDERRRGYYWDYDYEANEDFIPEEEGTTRSLEEIRAAKAKQEARRKALEEEARANAWRNRTLHVTFNGRAWDHGVRVGESLYLDLRSVDGENRLEIWEDDSGLRVVRSWWAAEEKQRLVVRPVGERGYGARLDLLEPSGKVNEFWGQFTSPNPAPGTWTLRATHNWRYGQPQILRFEAILDEGTEEERRWRFERPILPGQGTLNLGSFDIEP